MHGVCKCKSRRDGFTWQSGLIVCGCSLALPAPNNLPSLACSVSWKRAIGSMVCGAAERLVRVRQGAFFHRIAAGSGGGNRCVPWMCSDSMS